MSKTIEELAKSIAIDFIREHKGKINNDAPLTYECVQYTIERMFSKPLVQRLTDMQKEMVIMEYKEIQSNASFHEIKKETTKDQTAIKFHSQCKDFYVSQLKLLKRIFGKEFFKEDKL